MVKKIWGLVSTFPLNLLLLDVEFPRGSILIVCHIHDFTCWKLSKQQLIDTWEASVPAGGSEKSLLLLRQKSRSLWSKELLTVFFFLFLLPRRCFSQYLSSWLTHLLRTLLVLDFSAAWCHSLFPAWLEGYILSTQNSHFRPILQRRYLPGLVPDTNPIVMQTPSWRLQSYANSVLPSLLEACGEQAHSYKHQ